MISELFQNTRSIKQLSVLLIASAFVVSCGTSKKVSSSKKSGNKTVVKAENLRKLDSKFDGKVPRSVNEILKDAEKYLGTPYKFGGNTSSGFDCSGFTVKVFEENSFNLPRRSSDQAEAGQNIDIRDVKPGDLLFFATAGGSRVSHVGIVHDIGNDGEVRFIHASTSKGVIISSLNEKYWNKAYLHAQRVL
ncbi:C40 family peptidase [Chryseobacterium indologenes]|uniref:NlpC/P60 family protein n=2 Tax=Chryseobacterium indologenes TaxID=253 RepID=A0A3G5Z7A6_CHRID|nr:C40 family peptidase [Chryseobacterium indologenes]ATN07953.1 hydrolase Nlp/P60 [Chryseobacterium indologenes]AYY87203.1 NlpC/P60 family protein [Chryseobacterium indologenes]AYZ38173.1 NlpC/P60 family protein [Chryseobacterium indologenes]AZB20406.1 NlpC/P60 family protein [Chryseobacterium indologenes]MBF6644653.1 C40 family peptidase [Chryseobacterium indologenes]